MNKHEFLQSVEKYIKDMKISSTSFGIKAAGEPSFVFDLRKGREVREKKQSDILRFMQNNYDISTPTTRVQDESRAVED